MTALQWGAQRKRRKNFPPQCWRDTRGNGKEGSVHLQPNDSKPCTKCREVKPLSDFLLSNTGSRRPDCNSCRRSSGVLASRRWYASQGRWKSRVVSLYRKSRRYGLTVPTVAELSLALGEPTICGICGEAIVSWTDAEIDHTVPLSRGGSNSTENLSWSHRRCNAMKGTMMTEELIGLCHKIVDFQAGRV